MVERASRSRRESSGSSWLGIPRGSSQSQLANGRRIVGGGTGWGADPTALALSQQEVAAIH